MRRPKYYVKAISPKGEIVSIEGPIDSRDTALDMARNINPTLIVTLVTAAPTKTGGILFTSEYVTPYGA